MLTLEDDFPSSICWLQQMASGLPRVDSGAVKLALESRIQTNLDFFMISFFFLVVECSDLLLRRRKEETIVYFSLNLILISQPQQ